MDFNLMVLEQKKEVYEVSVEFNKDFAVVNRTFEVFKTNDNSLIEVRDTETGILHKIESELIDSLITDYNFEEAEALFILTFIKDVMDNYDFIFNTYKKSNFGRIAEIISLLSDTYGSPEWLIREIESLDSDTLITLLTTKNPVGFFKKIQLEGEVIYE